MLIDGIDALDWKPPPTPPVKGQKRKHVPKAAYSLEFEEEQARVAARLSIDEYEALPGIPHWCDDEHPKSKCHIIMWYRYHSALERLSMGIV